VTVLAGIVWLLYSIVVVDDATGALLVWICSGLTFLIISACILLEKGRSLLHLFWILVGLELIAVLYHIAIKMTVRYNLAMEVVYGKSGLFYG